MGTEDREAVSVRQPLCSSWGALGAKGCIICHRCDSCREVAQRNSPMRHVIPAAPAACEMLVAVAQHDSPEFRRQSQEYNQVSIRRSQEHGQVSRLWWGHCSRQPSPTYPTGRKSFCADPKQFLVHKRTPVLVKTLFLLLV